jgi:hypothetical protein
MVAKTKTIYYKNGSDEVCAKCGGDVDWIDCYDCENGYSHHDCGEDTCCCLDKSPNVVCDTCDGKGGWFRCYSCESKQNKEVSGNSSHT